MHNEILLIHKKEWNDAIEAIWMDLYIILVSEVKSDKGKYHIISLIMWKLLPT